MSEPLNAKPEAIREYLDRHYLTIAAVAARSGITSERVAELEEAGCIPGHTHEWRDETVVNGVFGEFRFPGSTVKFYHPSVVDWIRQTATFPDDMPLTDLAEKMYERFGEDLMSAIGDRMPPWDDPVNYAWAYILDGTWGACLKEIKPTSMLTKEYARKAIRELKAENRMPTEAEKVELRNHVAGYEEVAMPFAPHEVPTCSRTLEIKPAIKEWGLD